MPKLIELVQNAKVTRRQKAESISAIQQDAIQFETNLLLRLEDALLASVNEAVSKSVADINMAPIATKMAKAEVDLVPIQSALADLRKGADKPVQQWIDAAAGEIINTIKRTVPPKQDLRPIIADVKDAIKQVQFPKFVFVTEWDFRIERDTNGFIETVKATAAEWGETS